MNLDCTLFLLVWVFDINFFIQPKKGFKLIPPLLYLPPRL